MTDDLKKDHTDSLAETMWKSLPVRGSDLVWTVAIASNKNQNQNPNMIWVDLDKFENRVIKRRGK